MQISIASHQTLATGSQSSLVVLLDVWELLIQGTLQEERLVTYLLVLQVVSNSASEHQHEPKHLDQNAACIVGFELVAGEFGHDEAEGPDEDSSCDISQRPGDGADPLSNGNSQRHRYGYCKDLQHAHAQKESIVAQLLKVEDGALELGDAAAFALLKGAVEESEYDHQHHIHCKTEDSLQPHQLEHVHRVLPEHSLLVADLQPGEQQRPDHHHDPDDLLVNWIRVALGRPPKEHHAQTHHSDTDGGQRTAKHPLLGQHLLQEDSSEYGRRDDGPALAELPHRAGDQVQREIGDVGSHKVQEGGYGNEPDRHLGLLAHRGVLIADAVRAELENEHQVAESFAQEHSAALNVRVEKLLAIYILYVLQLEH